MLNWCFTASRYGADKTKQNSFKDGMNGSRTKIANFEVNSMKSYDVSCNFCPIERFEERKRKKYNRIFFDNSKQGKKKKAVRVFLNIFLWIRPKEPNRRPNIMFWLKAADQESRCWIKWWILWIDVLLRLFAKNPQILCHTHNSHEKSQSRVTKIVLMYKSTWIT